MAAPFVAPAMVKPESSGRDKTISPPATFSVTPEMVKSMLAVLPASTSVLPPLSAKPSAKAMPTAIAIAASNDIRRATGLFMTRSFRLFQTYSETCLFLKKHILDILLLIRKGKYSHIRINHVKACVAGNRPSSR